jgi:serine O-acetyltransferase
MCQEFEDKVVAEAIRADLVAIKQRDPACLGYAYALLYLKGFHGCACYRVANKLYVNDRKELAFAMQSRISEVFGIDIHPAAKIGQGIMFDHATGIVIGETAVVGDNCSIYHNVTLGGTGNKNGDRHPKLGKNVVIGACSSILGNIKIGDGVKVGPGSVVLGEIPPGVTVFGVPAKIVGDDQYFGPKL